MKKGCRRFLFILGGIFVALVLLLIFIDTDDEESYTYEDDSKFEEMFYDRYGYYPEDSDTNYTDYYDDSDYSYDYDDDTSYYDDDYDYDEQDFYDKDYYAAASEDKTYSNPDTKAKGADWTVLIYLCGSDLESKYSSAVTDINEMLTSKHGSNVNVILETGGANKWNGFNISASSLQRWKIADGKFTKVGETKNASMGASSTLSDFITWGVKNYPAKKYVLEFWNHGSGSISGVCFDEKYDDDSLYVYEMKEALEKANVHFEAVLFDTCLSATIEIADVLSGYADYQVSSEEVLYGGCFGYNKWFTALGQNPDWTGADLGKLIGPIYKSCMASIGHEDQYTMSTIDLKKISDLKMAFSAMASKMNYATQNVSSFRNLVKVGARVQTFGASSPLEGYTNLVDLGDFATHASAEVPDEAAALQKALKNCIVWEGHGADKSKSSGIAVYYPVKYQGMGDDYAKTTNNKEYLRYLDTILDDWEAPSWVYADARARSVTPKKSKEFKLDFETLMTEFDDGEYYTLKINSGSEAVTSVAFCLYQYVEEHNYYIYLGSDNDLAYYEDDPTTYFDNFGAEWVGIDGNLVHLELIESNENYNYYSVPVIINGDDSNLRVRYDIKKDKFKVLGAYDGLENGASSKGMRNLKNGDRISFVYPVYAVDNDESLIMKGDTSIVWNGNNKFDWLDLDEGVYAYSFEIVDMFGNYYDSDYAFFYYDGEEFEVYTE